MDPLVAGLAQGSQLSKSSEAIWAQRSEIEYLLLAQRLTLAYRGVQRGQDYPLQKIELAWL